MGPLKGLRVIELAGIGPTPFGAMMLADMGAEVITIERAAGIPGLRPQDATLRNRRSIVVNLKKPEGVELVLKLCESADALIEGFRPGVAERLGLGPEAVQARNPKLVYARMTGWGREGPLADRAGHDLNFLGVAGVASDGGGDQRRAALGQGGLAGDRAGGLPRELDQRDTLAPFAGHRGGQHPGGAAGGAHPREVRRAPGAARAVLSRFWPAGRRAVGSHPPPLSRSRRTRAQGRVVRTCSS